MYESAEDLLYSNARWVEFLFEETFLYTCVFNFYPAAPWMFLFRALSNYISLSNKYTFRKNVKPLFNATVNLAYFLSFLCQDIISLGQVA